MKFNCLYCDHTFYLLAYEDKCCPKCGHMDIKPIKAETGDKFGYYK